MYVLARIPSVAAVAVVASARAIAPLQVRRSPPNVAPHRLGSPRARLHRASPRVPALSPPTVARRRPYAEHGLPTKMYGINMATSGRRPEPRPVRAGLPGPSLAKGFICPPGLPRGHLDRLRGKALYPQIVLQVSTSYVQSLYSTAVRARSGKACTAVGFLVIVINSLYSTWIYW